MITARQLEALCAFDDYERAHGYAPTLRDLLRPLGVRSTNAVFELLSRLDDQGYLATREPRCVRQVRSLTLTSKGRERLREARQCDDHL